MALTACGASSVIRFGTRGSRLALEQTRLVLERFNRLYPEHATELVVVETEGDLDRVSSLQEIGGRGVFTSAIERAVFDGSVEAAIHSGHAFGRRFGGELYLETADELGLSGDTELANDFRVAARKLLGDDARLLDVEARIAERAGDTERARKALRRLLERVPDSVYVRRWLASLGE